MSCDANASVIVCSVCHAAALYGKTERDGHRHAGTEAAAAASRIGSKTALVTHKLSTIGEMSCNPAIGGLAKGQMVREIDVLGGAMGLFADRSGIQFKVLNKKKGRAVWSPRAQIDKRQYEKLVRGAVNNSDVDIIIGEVLERTKHPNADRLNLCTVFDGKVQLPIVCGAPNAKKDLLTIYAPPGSVIPKNQMKLSISKIRGVTSYGMLCSENELNLSDESAGIIELKNKEKEIGKSYFKTKSEKALDISITPNRADCLGVRGIARDLASSGLGSLLKLKKKSLKQTLKDLDTKKISIKLNLAI